MAISLGVARRIYIVKGLRCQWSKHPVTLIANGAPDAFFGRARRAAQSFPDVRFPEQ